MKTYIEGKEKALEDTISIFKSNYKKIGIEFEEEKFLNPISNIYSLLLREKSCKILFSNGKGASKLATLASALGEFAERLSTNYYFADFYLDIGFDDTFLFFKNEKSFKLNENFDIPKGVLNKELLDIYNPNQELDGLDLIDINSNFKKRGVVALEFEELKSKEKVYFPINILNNLYVSNGMAAGNSINEAKVQALCEIYERYVKKEVIKNSYSLPIIPTDKLNRYPQILEIIKSLEKENIFIRVYDASLNGVFPVVAIILINQKNSNVLLSFGSHPKFQIALERALNESFQGRGLNNLKDLKTPTFNKEEFNSILNLEEHFINSTGFISYDFFNESSNFEYIDWDFNGNIKEELAFLEEITYKQNLKIYISTFKELGFNVCQIIIPRMSEIYEIDDLIYNNNNRGAFFRDYILNLNTLNSNELKDLLNNLEEIDNSLNVAKFIGILAENSWSEVTILELKVLINIAIKNFKEALDLLEELFIMGYLREDRLKFYKALEALLFIVVKNKNLKNYITNLNLIFSENIIKRALDLIEQRNNFFDLEFGIGNFRQHQKLINFYKKLHLLKE